MKNHKFQRVIIYGHKPKEHRKFNIVQSKRHTHSYIHEGFFKAFRYLGYDTYWFDDRDNLSGENLRNSLFFTEDQGQKKIPLIPSSTYILHHTDNEKYRSVNAKILNLCNYVFPLENGISFNYPGSKVEKISDMTFYDAENQALYQPWATNLLPFEIKEYDVKEFDYKQKMINYVGSTKYEDLPVRFKNFKSGLLADGVKFKNYTNVNDSAAQELIGKSRISIDIRAAWHLECGYIPCRIWKSLSYGKYIGSNSALLRQHFGNFIHISENESELYSTTLESYAKNKKSTMNEAMLWIKANHTFLNRAQNLLNLIDRI